MLTEYIVEYAKARKTGDKKSMKRIERDLQQVGDGCDNPKHFSR